MRIINYKFYIKFILFIIFFSILFIEVIKNKNLIIKIINDNKIFFTYILFLQLFYHLILNYRAYVLYNKFSKKIISFSFWSKTFFKSLIFNISLNLTGTIYRALTLKKIGMKYEVFLAILYVLFFSYFITNFLCIVLELFFFTDITFYFKLIYLLAYLILTYFFFYSPKILNFFLKKFTLLKNYLKIIITINNFIISFNKKELLISKNFINIFGFSLILHLLEISIFIISYNIFFPKFSVEIILLLFAISFLLDRIPFLTNIVGSSEVLFGFFSTFLGLLFYEGMLIKFLIRLTGMFAIFISYIFFKYRFEKFRKIIKFI
jgi:hypothetical protein